MCPWHLPGSLSAHYSTSPLDRSEIRIISFEGWENRKAERLSNGQRSRRWAAGPELGAGPCEAMPAASPVPSCLPEPGLHHCLRALRRQAKGSPAISVQANGQTRAGLLS